MLGIQLYSARKTRMELHSNMGEFLKRLPEKRKDPRYTTKTMKFVKGRVRV